MSAKSVRKRSWKAATRLGFPTNPDLPLIDEPQHLKSQDEAINRLLCLYVVTACAFGFDGQHARAWLEREGIRQDLTVEESRFVTTGKGDFDGYVRGIEGIWALAWALSLVDELDFEKDCDDDFIDLFPRARRGESSAGLRAKAKLRSYAEIHAACDLAYCLHWGVRESGLKGLQFPGKIETFVFRERRHALEWLISNVPWDEVSLDT